MRRMTPPPEPASLRSAKTLAERKAAAEFFADPAHAALAFAKPGFTAYSGTEIRDTLNVAFGFKCAYCESYFGATQPVAVEHFRPKGKVKVREPDAAGVWTTKAELKPGYYWLASDWSNLLPSCTDCNSERRQLLPGRTGPVTAGKANQFPIAAETDRARRPGDEQHEGRLLLHPYLDDPGEHLHFVDADGEFRDGEVGPAVGADGIPSPMGVASIEVYALQRRGLIDARGATLKLLRAALADVEDDLDDIHEHGQTPALVKRYKRHLAELKGFADPGRPYSVMCAQVIDSAYARLFGGIPA